MKNKFLTILVFLTFFTYSSNVNASSELTEKQNVILLFNEKVDERIIIENSGTILHTFDNIPAVSASFPITEDLSELEQDHKLNIIVPEKKIEIMSQVNNWGYDLLEANRFKENNLTGKNINISVIDTGIDSEHEDLKVAGGKSFVSYTNLYTDDNGHGSHIAGIIAAKDNNVGVTGIAPNANIYSLKAFNQKGEGTTIDLAEAVDYAMEINSDVINLSFEYNTYDPIVEALLNEAYKQNILIVGAAGNSGTNISYPAVHSSVIAVGAIDTNLKKASFSSTGNTLEIVAPGVDINSTWKNNRYNNMSGTSMATAFVSGYLAILKEANPSMSAIELRDLLHSHTIDLGKPGKDTSYGYGLIENFLPIEDVEEEEKNDVQTPNKEDKQESYSNYFKVIKSSPPIYIKDTNGQLIKAGTLQKDTVFPRVQDYGNWHEIRLGNQFAYIHKDHTEPISNNSGNTITKGNSKGSEKFTTLTATTVYDSSNGQLSKIGMIEKGMKYTIEEDYGNWVIVNFAGRKGYVNKNNIKTEQQTSIYRANDDLSLYVKEDGKLIKKATILKSQLFKQERDYGNWHEVSFGHTKGYIYKSQTTAVYNKPLADLKHISTTFKTDRNQTVYTNENGKLIPLVTLEKNVSYPIISDYGNWVVISVAGRKAYIYKENVTFTFNKSDIAFSATIDNLSIYQNKSGNLVEVGSIKKGETFSILSDYGNWHKIQIGNDTGFVYKEKTMPILTNQMPDSVSKSAIKFKTVHQGNVYDNSSNKLTLLAEFNTNKTFTAISWYGDWLKIDIAGRIGFVHKNNIKLL
ncbi:S8 family peptidase [Bacillus sp. J37]|uniref:S8 family peptidase n=1 Tax=Bacillus sp. J37 TaxID=935837 RepID=UPI0004B65BF8|nr:S8 family peptidase [Bacillus sp. J37]